MPTITFPKEDLKRFLGGEADDETIREAMSMIGTDIDAFDEEISVEVFPNRPDLLSVQGLARALNHFLGFSDEVDTYPMEMGDGDVKILPSAKGVRPHTRCAIIRGVTFDDATIKHVIDVQEKLHLTFGRNRRRVAIGIYPLEHITLPITFGAEPPEDILFEPLEADKEMNGKEILEEHATGKKYAHLLDGLPAYPVFRDATGKVLSMPPVINSHDVGRVTQDTKDVFVECSGHDPKPLEEALHMICCVLADLGGTVERMKLIYPDTELYSPNLEVKKARIDRGYVVSRAGIPDKDLARSLKRMGLRLEEDMVSIPCYRTDFLHDVDVVEDALIGYGYGNIKERVPAISTIGRLGNQHVYHRAMRDVLEGIGLTEVMTYFLTGQGVRLANPLSENYAALRTGLLNGLLDVLAKNTSNTYPQNLFELGTVFTSSSAAETGVEESMRLCITLCGETDYTQARQALEALAAAMDWRLGFEEHESERFIPGRSAHISGTVSGVIGEVHPRELSERGITQPVAALEITLP